MKPVIESLATSAGGPKPEQDRNHRDQVDDGPDQPDLPPGVTPARLAAARASITASGNASTSRLARELGVGWRVAERIMGVLEAEGAVTKASWWRGTRTPLD